MGSRLRVARSSSILMTFVAFHLALPRATVPLLKTMKNRFGSLALSLLTVSALAVVTACSSAPDPNEGTTEEALPTGGGGGGRGTTCVWPLANPHYCPPQFACGKVTNAASPTPPDLVARGCAPYSLEMDWGGCHPYNGPMGAITGTYVLCPTNVTLGQTDQHFCNTYLPQAPPFQRWVIAAEAVGPCQSGCHLGTGTGTGGSGTAAGF
jgi:hypothetical protein